MRATLIEGSFRRISTWELPVCRYCHRLGTERVQRFFSGISKVGDGHYWYVVLGLLLLVQGRAALPLFAQVAVAGTVCHMLYKRLKNRTARPRPFAFAEGFELAVPPLDKYSFPSGHTLHAVFFTVLVTAHFPFMAWLLVPFSLLVAASRVVLGLHYPTDVVAGAVLGASLAQLSFLFF